VKRLDTNIGNGMNFRQFFYLCTILCLQQSVASTVNVPDNKAVIIPVEKIQFDKNKNQNIEEILIYFFNAPNLIEMDDKGKIRGSFFDKFEDLATKSNLRFHYKKVTIPRLENEMANPAVPSCVLTIFKSDKRSGKFNYIYEYKDKVKVKVYRHSAENKIVGLESFSQNSKLTLVTHTPIMVESLGEKGLDVKLILDLDLAIRMLATKKVQGFVGADLLVESTEEFKNKEIVPVSTVAERELFAACSNNINSTVLEKLRAGFLDWEL
jgi:hypothetical protein